MTLEELTAEFFDELAGFDSDEISEIEAHRLLNQADTELCTRSGWTRANLDLGPTVEDQAAYALPENVFRPLKVKVEGKPYDPADEETIDRLNAGELRLRSWGLWWLSFDENGVESVSLYPTPSADLSLTALSVIYPTEMTENDDEPASPKDWNRCLVDYAAALAYGYGEDNPQLRDYHQQKFEDQVARLRGHRNMRTGRGDVRMRIERANA